MTPDYEVTLQGWIREWERETAALEALLGTEEVMDRQMGRRRALVAIRKGLIGRYLVTGGKSTVL